MFVGWNIAQRQAPSFDFPLLKARRTVQNWQLWATAAALSAAVTALLIKVGVQGVDAGLATLFRTVAVAVVLGLVLLASGRLDWQELRHLPPTSLTALALSGLATGVSWFCYSRALQLGPVAGVAALEVHPDRALLLPVGSHGADRIELLAIAERHLHPERAIGLQGDLLIADEQAGAGFGGAIDDQLGIGHQPEGALAHIASARFAAAAGPQAGIGGVEQAGLIAVEIVLMQHLRADAATAEAAAAGQLIHPFMLHAAAVNHRLADRSDHPLQGERNKGIGDHCARAIGRHPRHRRHRQR